MDPDPEIEETDRHEPPALSELFQMLMESGSGRDIDIETILDRIEDRP